MLRALIFDVDGTLADTESAHRAAFNRAFVEVGLGWYWDEALYGQLLHISGGKERLLHYWNTLDPDSAGGPRARDTIDRVHAVKTGLYEQQVAGGRLPLRPGVLRLVREAQARQLRLAIATTTTPANIDALLRTPLGPHWRDYFSVVEDASTAPLKKPHPQVYLQALQGLGLDGAECIAFEDSGHGLRAAAAAGIACVVTPTRFTAGQCFDDALRVLSHLGDATDGPGVGIDTLRRWHGGFQQRLA